jgi:hypothetical protein
MTIPTVPNALTFQQAIAITQDILAAVEQGDCTEVELESAIATLVSNKNGARGFFVTYLTGDSPLADEPTDAVIRGLKAAPELVAELLVKNLAMSTGMAITHRRNQDEDMAQGSDRVRSRTLNLIHQLQLADITQEAQKLKHSATSGQGDYATFLDRWGYDAEQRQMIEQTVQDVL